MKRIMAAVLVSTLLLATAGTALAGKVSNTIVPLSEDFSNRCYGEDGEFVHVTGNLHIAATQFDDGKGSPKLVLHFNPQGVSGVGETSGIIYRATGMDQQIVTLTNDGQIISEVSNMNLVALGKAPNNTFHILVVTTLDADGEIMGVDIKQESDQCR